MKYIVFLISLFSTLQSAQLILNRYQEANQSVDIYHLSDRQPIACHTEFGKGFETKIVCTLAHPVTVDRKYREESFFTIRFEENRVIFIAKKYAKLFPVNTHLIDQTTVRQSASVTHWVIVGSHKKPAIIPDFAESEFNFPVTYTKKEAPFVGALDLNGNPVQNKKGAIYLAKIKKLYNQKKYHDVLKLIDQYKKSMKDSFESDIALYRLRALSQIAKESREGYETLLTEAKEWIADNPSNKHIPEVYKFVVQSYLGKGRLKQGEKYLNLLKSGFDKHLQTQQAMLIYADTIYKSKKRRPEALKIYKDVLYATQDLDTASYAALRIANAYLDMKKPEKAETFVRKVLKSNPAYLKEDLEESLDMALRFGNYERYRISLDILSQLDQTADKETDAKILKYLAYYNEMDGEREQAIALYNRYLKKYPKGEDVAFVKKHLDGLMIAIPEQNLTKKLAFLDRMLKQYQDKRIRRNALEEKARLLYSLKRYDEVLQMQAQLEQYKLDTWIRKSALALAKASLQQNKCEEAVVKLDEYNITLPAKYDEALFQCYLKTGKYQNAKALIDQHIQSDNLREKLQWLYLAVQFYKKRDANKKVILTAEDVLKLAHNMGIKRYDDVLYDIAEAYYNLREYDDLMLQTVERIEVRFPDDMRNVDLFMKVVRYAQKRDDLMLETNYAKKVIALQKRFKIDVYSPRIEILYAHGLKKLGKKRQALQVVLDLLKEKLTDAQKAEVLYLAGELSLELGKRQEAIAFYQKCGEIVQDSAWQKLCAQNLQILTE